jgi:hypothetical protein
MSRMILVFSSLVALGLFACDAQRPTASDGQSHWLQACQSSTECGDAACLCGVCSRGCSADAECGAAQPAQCVEVAALGGACATPAGASKICVAAGTATRSDAAQSIAGASPEAGPPGGSGGSVGVGTSDGGAAGASADAAAGDGGASGAAGPDAAVCTGFESMPTRTPLTVQIINDTGQRIYLGSPIMGCGVLPRFTLETEQGEAVGYARLSGCDHTCEEMQRGFCGCNPDCPQTPVIALEWGDMHEVQWDGIVVTHETMPLACYGQGCQPGIRCAVERTADEPLNLRAQAYPEFTCREGATCGPCEENLNGDCVISNAELVRGTPRTVTVPWVPGQVMISLTFL